MLQIMLEGSRKRERREKEHFHALIRTHTLATHNLYHIIRERYEIPNKRTPKKNNNNLAE